MQYRPLAREATDVAALLAVRHWRNSGVFGGGSLSLRSRKPGKVPSQIFHTNKKAHPMFLLGAPWNAAAPACTMDATVLT